MSNITNSLQVSFQYGSLFIFINFIKMISRKSSITHEENHTITCLTSFNYTSKLRVYPIQGYIFMRSLC